MKAYAQAAEALPAGDWQQGVEVELPAGATVGDLRARLGLRPQAVQVVLVNGVAARPSTPLKDGDRVAVFPLVGGGRAPSRTLQAGRRPPARRLPPYRMASTPPR
ncbi:MAG: MoaD/ThiS family protein [Acetobacteraceae bacterium]|nr:MoaD/ThiS family protein [Acetobacteraceae bacterium]